MCLAVIRVCVDRYSSVVEKAARSHSGLSAQQLAEAVAAGRHSVSPDVDAACQHVQLLHSLEHAVSSALGKFLAGVAEGDGAACSYRMLRKWITRAWRQHTTAPAGAPPQHRPVYAIISRTDWHSGVLQSLFPPSTGSKLPEAPPPAEETTPPTLSSHPSHISSASGRDSSPDGIRQRASASLLQLAGMSEVDESAAQPRNKEQPASYTASPHGDAGESMLGEVSFSREHSRASQRHARLAQVTAQSAGEAAAEAASYEIRRLQSSFRASLADSEAQWQRQTRQQEAALAAAARQEVQQAVQAEQRKLDNQMRALQQEHKLALQGLRDQLSLARADADRQLDQARSLARQQLQEALQEANDSHKERLVEKDAALQRMLQTKVQSAKTQAVSEQRAAHTAELHALQSRLHQAAAVRVETALVKAKKEHKVELEQAVESAVARERMALRSRVADGIRSALAKQAEQHRDEMEQEVAAAATAAQAATREELSAKCKRERAAAVQVAVHKNEQEWKERLQSDINAVRTEERHLAEMAVEQAVAATRAESEAEAAAAMETTVSDSMRAALQRQRALVQAAQDDMKYRCEAEHAAALEHAVRTAKAEAAAAAHAAALMTARAEAEETAAAAHQEAQMRLEAAVAIAKREVLLTAEVRMQQRLDASREEAEAAATEHAASLAQMQAAHATATTRANALASNLLDSESKLVTAQGDLEDSRVEASRLASALAAAREHNKEQRKNMAAIENKLIQQEDNALESAATCKRLQADVARATAALAQCRTRNTQLQEQVDEEKPRVEQATQDAAALALQLAQAEQRSGNATSRLENEIVRLRSAHEEAIAAENALQEEIQRRLDNCKQQLVQAQQQEHQTAHRLRELQQDLDAAQAQVEQAQKAAAGEETNRHGAEVRAQEATSEYQAFKRNTLDELQQLAASCAASSHALRKALAGQWVEDEGHMSSDSENEEFETPQARIRQLILDADLLQERYTALQAKFNRRRDAAGHTAAQLQECQESLQATRDSLTHTHQSLAAAEGALESCRGESGAVEADLRSRLSAAEGALESCRGESGAVEANLRAQLSKLKELYSNCLLQLRTGDQRVGGQSALRNELYRVQLLSSRLESELKDETDKNAALVEQVSATHSKQLQAAEAAQTAQGNVQDLQGQIQQLEVELEKSIPAAEMDAAVSTWEAERARLQGALSEAQQAQAFALQRERQQVAATARGETCLLLAKVAAIAERQMGLVDNACAQRLGACERRIVAAADAVRAAAFAPGSPDGSHSSAHSAQLQAMAGLSKTPHKHRGMHAAATAPADSLMSPAAAHTIGGELSHAAKSPYAPDAAHGGKQHLAALSKVDLYEKLRALTSALLEKDQRISQLSTKLAAATQPHTPPRAQHKPPGGRQHAFPPGTTMRLWDEQGARNVLISPSDDLEPSVTVRSEVPFSPSAGAAGAMASSPNSSSTPVFTVPQVAYAALLRSKATCARLLDDLSRLKRQHARELDTRDLALTSLRGEALHDKAERIAMERSFSSLQHESRMRVAGSILGELSPPRADSSSWNAPGAGEAAHDREQSFLQPDPRHSEGVNVRVLDGLSSVGSLSSTDDEGAAGEPW